MTQEQFDMWVKENEDNIVADYIEEYDEALQVVFCASEYCHTDDVEEYERWLNTLTINDIPEEYVAEYYINNTSIVHGDW